MTTTKDRATAGMLSLPARHAPTPETLVTKTIAQPYHVYLHPYTTTICARVVEMEAEGNALLAKEL